MSAGVPVPDHQFLGTRDAGSQSEEKQIYQTILNGAQVRTCKCASLILVLVTRRTTQLEQPGRSSTATMARLASTLCFGPSHGSEKPEQRKENGLPPVVREWWRKQILNVSKTAGTA